jgi:hypothetical protein
MDTPRCTERPRRTLALTRGEMGFGHRVGALIFGIDLAQRTGARLVLADAYWNVTPPKPYRIVVFPSMPWAWELLPLPRASGPEPAAALGIDDYLEAHARGAACGVRWVNTQGTSCEDQRWCFEAYHGAYDRSVSALKRLAGERVGRAVRPKGTLRVLWHLRSGDNMARLRNVSALHAVREAIDADTRGPVATDHQLITAEPEQLLRAYPWLVTPWPGGLGLALDEQFLLGEDVLATVRALAGAPVLVSTGSSFALAAAALAPVGRQVHLMFPPKELGMHTFHGLPTHSRDGLLRRADALHTRDLQRSGWFRTHFMRANTVPLGLDGVPFPHYAPKRSRALAAIATRGVVPRPLAEAQYEYWLPGTAAAAAAAEAPPPRRLR